MILFPSYSHGHIPLSHNDPAYAAELAREQLLNMPACHCSNCDTDGCDRLYRYHPFLTLSEFDMAVSKGVPESTIIPERFNLEFRISDRSTEPTPCGPNDFLRSQPACVDLCSRLSTNFRSLFDKVYSESFSDVGSEALFNEQQAWLICKNHTRLTQDLSLDSILGSEALEGMYKIIMKVVDDWVESPVYEELSLALEDESIRIDQHYLDAIEIEKEKEKNKKDREARLALQKADKLDRRLKREANQAAKLKLIEDRKAWWASEALVLAEYKQKHWGHRSDVQGCPGTVSRVLL